MGKFDDKGIFGPNKFRKGNDKAPTHKGIVNLSHEMLKALLQNYKDTGEAKLEIAGWRKTDNPDQISLKISIPRERDEDDRGSRSSPRRRRDDDDEDTRPPRRRAETRRRDDDEDDYNDDIPFEDRPRGRKARRDDDYGDERDL